VDVDLVLADQVQQEIERPVEGREGELVGGGIVFALLFHGRAGCDVDLFFLAHRFNSG
jgi:hypothetical protein